MTLTIWIFLMVALVATHIIIFFNNISDDKEESDKEARK